MNSTFMMHCGGRPVGFEDPALSFVPEKTETYEPVPFSELILNTKRVCRSKNSCFRKRPTNVYFVAIQKRWAR